MKTEIRQLALNPATSRKNYYVNLYFGSLHYTNRKLFIPFYGKDYNSEVEAKKAAFKEFLQTSGGCDFYDYVTITEHNGMQKANKNEPFQSKSAIVKLLAHKNVPLMLK